MYSYFFSGSAGYYAALTPQIDSAAWLLALVFVGEVCNTGIVVVAAWTQDVGCTRVALETSVPGLCVESDGVSGG